MKNSKLFIFLFFIGLLCLGIAGLSLFLGLNPSLTKLYVQYEIGQVLFLDGNVKKALSESKRQSLSIDQKIYSKERFVLGPDSSASFKISGEKIDILGPADFKLEVISPETKKVFVNFSDFDDIKPKKGFSNLILTYKGWMIEPYFEKGDFDDSSLKEIELPAISQDDESADSFNKESLLDELIASKRSLLKRCYENYLRKNPMATGKLVVEFTLQNTGKVSSSRIKDSSFFKDESFKNCVQDVFKRISTSPFDGDSILVTYPIEFE